MLKMMPRQMFLRAAPAWCKKLVDHVMCSSYAISPDPFFTVMLTSDSAVSKNNKFWFVQQVYHGLASAARGILQERGIRGLYSGLNITLLEIIPHSALQFGSYDFLTRSYEAYRCKLLKQVAFPTLCIHVFQTEQCQEINFFWIL